MGTLISSSARSLRLAPRTIVVTRPAAQAGRLSQMLQAEGAQVELFPVIDIVPMGDLSALQQMSQSLALFDMAFFVSANAVEFTFQIFNASSWPEHVKVSTVGPATVRALQAHGFAQVIAPKDEFDSEAVLALPEFQAAAVNGKRILVLRGESDGGSRELLTDTLREQGAQVQTVACYQRVCAQLSIDPLLDKQARSRLDALTFTSSEGVRYFAKIAGAQALPRLFELPCFAPHPRIVAQLQALGAQQAYTTAPADEGVVAGLCDYFSHCA